MVHLQGLSEKALQMLNTTWIYVYLKLRHLFGQHLIPSHAKFVNPFVDGRVPLPDRVHDAVRQIRTGVILEVWGGSDSGWHEGGKIHAFYKGPAVLPSVGLVVLTGQDGLAAGRAPAFCSPQK